MVSKPRLKVLLSAYACEPHRGSEPGVGWNWTLQLAERYEVWVLVWSKFREPIEKELAGRDDLANVHFVYYDLPRWAKPLARSERIEFLLWQFGVLPTARRLQREIGFDIVHHLNYITVEVPGLLWSLGVPFVWGPAGGGQVPPAALKSYFNEIWLVEMGRALRKKLLRFNPLVRMAGKRASFVMVANADTERVLDGLVDCPVLRFSETAVQLPQRTRADLPANEVFTIGWWGHLIPRKGPLLAVDVADELRRRGARFRLKIGGVGPWQQRIERRIAELGLDDYVELSGYVSFDGMADLYDTSDAYLFTSLQDTSGNVVLEAMSHELPVVCLDHHGAAEMVTPECGIKVPIKNRKQVVADMAAALHELHDDPERRRRLGKAGRERVAAVYSWSQKGEMAAQLYERAIGSKPAAGDTTPDLRAPAVEIT